MLSVGHAITRRSERQREGNIICQFNISNIEMDGPGPTAKGTTTHSLLPTSTIHTSYQVPEHAAHTQHAAFWRSPWNYCIQMTV